MRFLLCFLCFLSLVFANYEKQIAEFDSKFASSNNKVAFHHQLQNLYIQSIINDDDLSKVKLLKRLVISSNALNLDDSAYTEELRAYQISEAEIKSLQTALASKSDEKPQKTNAQPQKTQPLKDEGQNSQKTSDKISKKENASQNSQETNAKASKNENTPQISQESKEPSTQGSKKIFVLNAKQEENKLILKFNENIEEKDLIKAELKEKDKYRYIIDFQAALDTGRKEFQFKESKFLLAQFNPQTTRLVLYATQKPEFELSLKDKELVIALKNEAESKKQSQETKAKEKTQEKQIAKKEPEKIASKPKEAEIKSIAKDEKKDENKKLYILKNAKEANGIRLTLNDELKEAEISSFEMKDKDTYRLILDFEAVLEGGRKNYTFDKNSITLTQYTPKIVRIVLNSPSKIKSEKELSKKSFFVGFDEANSKTSKAQNKTTQNANKTGSNSAKNSTTTKTTQSQKTTSYKANSNKIIVIDAGHGGKDAGAVGGSGKWLEKNVVLSVSLKVGEELKKRGYKVFYTRTNDKFINLKDRTKIANNKKANLFISIHANAAPNAQKAKQMQGIETFFLSPARSERSKEVASKENKTDLEEANFFLKQNFLGVLSREKIIASNRLAIDIQKNLLSSVRKSHKVTDGGVREGPFWVLVGAQDMPAVLVELGYISHPEEGRKLTQRAYQDLLARGIANGVQNYFANNP